MNSFDGDNVNNKISSNDNKHSNEEENANVTGMLLNLSQKTTIFVDDQTPTPTRLIKNCEEVGLFEDLCHVNPFEETFRKACEQCGSQNALNHSTLQTTVKTTGAIALTDDETSLHTPQVFPQYDVVREANLCDSRNDNLTKHPLDIPTTTVLGDPIIGSQTENGLNVNNLIRVANCLGQIDNSCSNNNNNKTLNEFKPVAIITTTTTTTTTTTRTTTIKTKTTTEAAAATTTASCINFLPTTLQFIQQPQVIPVTFPAIIQSEQDQQQQQQQSQQQQEILFTSAIKSKPLILPKLSNTQINSIKNTGSILNKSAKLFHNNKPITTITLTTHNNSYNNEPSSASLTPTSQLPIKERLKAILSQSGKSHLKEWPKNNTNHNDNDKIEAMARRRAASSRYRNKIRIEHKELKKQNIELKSENESLKKRIKHLEMELIRLQTIAANNNRPSDNDCQQNLSTQLHIPASTIHLIMNIPKIMIPIDHRHRHGDTFL